MKLPASIAAIPLLLLCSFAHAQVPITTVKNLLVACDGGPGSDKYPYCIAYIAGISDWMTVVGQAPLPRPWHAILGECPPEETTYRAAVEAFVTWARNHPEAWSQRAAIGVASAVRGLGVCK
jgi:hypothetical protein